MLPFLSDVIDLCVSTAPNPKIFGSEGRGIESLQKDSGGRPLKADGGASTTRGGSILDDAKVVLRCGSQGQVMGRVRVDSQPTANLNKSKQRLEERQKPPEPGMAKWRRLASLDAIP